MSNTKKLDELEAKHHNSIFFSLDDIRFLYELDGPIETFGNEKDARIQMIINGRIPKNDLSIALNLRPEQISLDTREAMNGNIVFHYGDLELSHGFSNIDGLIFPQRVSGSLLLRHTYSAKGTAFPEHVDQHLIINNLSSGEGVKLPRFVGKNVFLNKMYKADGAKFPEYVGGNFNLGVIHVNDISLPEYVGKSIFLDLMKSVRNLTLPKYIGGQLFLNSIESAKFVTMPEYLYGSIVVSHEIQATEYLDIPEQFSIYLSHKAIYLRSNPNAKPDLETLEYFRVYFGQ